MKYRASDIIKRAYDLADIKNTDFITHEENIQYINDAWKQVYQWLINKGDRQFVQEVRLAGGGFTGYVEYDLPEDLYQICSIKSASGQLVSRKAESESNSSGTYEIVNGKLRLYGCTSDLILTYWLTPVWITYPEEDLEVANLTQNEEIIDSLNNSVLVYDGETSDVLNLVTGETLISGLAGNPDLLSDGNLAITDEGKLYDFNGNLIRSSSLDNVKSTSKYKNQAVVNNKLILTNVEIGDNTFFLGGNDRSYFTVEDGEIYRTDNFGIKYDTGVVYNGDEHFKSHFIDIDGNRCIWMIGDYIYYYDGEELKEISGNFINPKAVLKRGVLTYDGSWKIKSYEEDTLFNFPNELYTSLLAADLAVRYAMKMNANIDGLNQLYQVMQTTFMNTLTQDGGYTRINNVYRA